MSEFSFFDLTTHGVGGWDMYRVPGLIVTGAGDILVYYEARAEHAETRALFCRRSTDEGASFSEAFELVEQKQNVMLHNPQMIAGQGSEVFFFWNEDYLHLYMKKSTDGGYSWGKATDLTGVVEGWRTVWPLTLFAIAPGHGVRMDNGTLVVPIWLSRGVNAHNPACFACLYSCDNGASWQRSDLVQGNGQVVDPTEGSVAEAENDTLLITMRHGAQQSRRRAFAKGRLPTLGKAYLNEELPDPICAGSLLRLSDHTHLFCNCAWGDEECLKKRRQGSSLRWSKNARQRLCVRRSTDNGKSFSKGALLAQEGGYSDLAQSTSGRWIYCFYERGWIEGDCIFNEHLAFARFTPDWVQ